MATGAQLDMLFWDTTNIPQLLGDGKLLPLNDVLENIYKDIGIGFPTARKSGSLQPIMSLILNNGGHLVSADLKDVAFDSQEVREAYELMKELAQYLPPGTGNWANPQQVDAIVRGTVATGHCYGRVFQNVEKSNKPLIGKLSNTLSCIRPRR
jgi:hypothetical protein